MSKDPFAAHVEQGLRQQPKKLSSRFFYDERGDELFQQIMHMPEYYLTNAEAEIFRDKAQEILQALNLQQFELIELGAGDGYKTKILLKNWLDSGASFTYRPIDISENVLQILVDSLHKELPGLDIKPVQGTYRSALNQLASGRLPKVILFLGSNIGNMEKAEAVSFLQLLHQALKPGDQLLIGFDLKKDPEVILKAYNDPAGITAAFNLNLLHRINRELEGNFQVDQFRHWETYDPQTGETRSFIVSLRAQTVRLGKLNKSIKFEAWESISVELSLKYNPREIRELAESAGFKYQQGFQDSREYFLDAIWKRT